MPTAATASTGSVLGASSSSSSSSFAHCQEFLGFLRSAGGDDLDDLSMRCLVEIRWEIDTRIARQPPPAPPTTSSPLPSAQKVAAISWPWKKTKKQKTQSAAHYHHHHHPHPQAKTVKVLPGRPITDRGTDRFPPRKRRSLLALTPYLAFTDAETRTTLMSMLFGDGATQIWFAWKKLIVPMAWVAYLSYFVFGWLAFTENGSDESWRTTLFAAVYLVSVLFFCLHYSAMMNFKILSASAHTFDTLFFLVELVGYDVSLWGTLCFSLSGLLLCLGDFLAMTTLLSYDSYPLSFRRGNKVVMLMSCLLYAGFLMLIYLRQAETMCLYRLDFSHGVQFILEQEGGGADVSMAASSTRIWSISLFEFCLNRGFTLLVLRCRTLYWCWKFPDDCVLIRSRLRMVETIITSPEEEKGGGGGRADETTSLRRYSPPPHSHRQQSGRRGEDLPRSSASSRGTGS